MVCAASVDELNFLAARIEQLDPAEIGKLNAALQQKNGFENIGQVIDFTYNVDFYVHIPEVHNYHDIAVLGKRAFFLRGSVPAKSRKVNAAFPFFGHLYHAL